MNGPLHLPALESPDHLRLSALRVFDQVTYSSYISSSYICTTEHDPDIIQNDVPRENGGIFEP